MAERVKNLEKGEAYKEAFERIALSLEKGFPLEAIALIESIMSDRLLSNAVGTGQLKQSPEKALRIPFNDLIDKFTKYAAETGDSEAAELAPLLDEWRMRRNGVIHSAVKSYPTTAPSMRPEEFRLEATEAAHRGVEYARRLLQWHRSRLRAIRREGSSPGSN